MAIVLTVTDAGRAALVNAANTGTAAVTIAAVGISGAVVAPDKAMTALPGETKRIATLSGDVVADDTIHLIVRDESSAVFTVRSFGLYLADGTLFAIYGQSGVILEKSSQALMLLAIDVQFADIAAAQLTFGDANFLNPPATTERQGVVELATYAETLAGDALRVPAAKTVKDAVFTWQNERLGVGNSDIWHPGNDGSGSGLDADLLDGQQGSYYTDIPSRLGFVPVQQGTGVDQTGNRIKIGWSLANRLKATVDTSDQGYFVFDAHISNVWRSSNDGAGSGLDADLLDGQQGSYYADVLGRLGYTPLNKADDTVTGIIRFRNTRNEAMASLTDFDGPLQALGNGTGAAVITLHRPSSFACYFGLDTDNILKVGGWSFGAAAHRIWHSGIDGAGSGLDADLLDGIEAVTFARRDQDNTFAGEVRSTAANGFLLKPAGSTGSTIIHRNDGVTYYVLASAPGSGGPNSSWSDLRPFCVNLTNGQIRSENGQDFRGGTDITGNLRMLAAGGAIQFEGVSAGERHIEFHRKDGVSYLYGNGSGVGMYDTQYGSFWSYEYGGQFFIRGATAWHAGNDGAGSGLDADLLDGQQAGFFTDIAGRLGFTPVRQGTGVGQLSGNTVSIGWSGSRLKATVDSSDQGNLVTDGWLGNGTLGISGSSLYRGGMQVWGPDNDGAGSGLDADLLDGFQANAFERVVGQSLAENAGYTVFASGKKECWGQLTIGANAYATWVIPTQHSSWINPGYSTNTEGGNTGIQQNTGVYRINTDANGAPYSITFWNADDRTVTIWPHTVGV